MISSNSKYFIGIDVGGTNTKLGLITASGEIVKRTGFSTNACLSDDQFLTAILKSTKDVINGIDVQQLGGIGIGSPAANYYEGTIGTAANLNWDQPIQIKSFLESCFSVPVEITNDANLAAFGEKCFGKAKLLDDFVSITLGTGMGCGIFMNGKLVHGITGMAGEIGHVIVETQGRLCQCGREGCLETYVSASGMKRTALEIMAVKGSQNTTLSDISVSQLTSKDIADAALQGDDIAQMVFTETGNYLGLALANITALLSPEAIFISGGPMSAGSLLMEPIIESFKSNLLHNLNETTRIEVSANHANDISLLGAAALVINKRQTLDQHLIVNR